MQRPCDYCGKPFEAKRSTARYCSSSHRGLASYRRSLAGEAEVVQLPAKVKAAPRTAARTAQAEPSEPPAEPNTDRSLASVVRAQLEGAGKLDTYAGQQALVLAGRLRPEALDNGSALAAISRELDRLMSALLAEERGKSDPLDQAQDEVTRMRSRRRGA